MVYDLSAVLPVLVAVALLALAGSAASLAVLGQTVARHHRLRVAGHQSIPPYYRRQLLAH
jgi:hypothetical protein